MRNISFSALLQCFLVVAVTLFSLQGCARYMRMIPASDQEASFVSESLIRYKQEYLERCNCCLDAEDDVAISISGWFKNHKGNLSGYLQGRGPGN